MTCWDEMPLLDVARLRRGTEPGSASYTGASRGVRFLRVGDVTGKTDNPMFTDSTNVVLADTADLLLTLDGSPGHVSTGHEGAISSGIRKVEPIDPTRVSVSWLRYSLMSPAVQETIRRHTTGITILHAAAAVQHIRIPVPPPTEQKRIVEVLDEVEALCSLRRESNRCLSTLSQALFTELVAKNQEDWREDRLEGLCSTVEDCPHSTPTYSDTITDYPCLRSSDIQEGRLDWSTTKYVDEAEYKDRVRRLVPLAGDVVYCREGARLGNAAIILEGVTPCLGQRMMLFRPAHEVATSEFIWAFLNSGLLRQQMEMLIGGAASPHINVRDIKAFVVLVPPFSLQVEFATRVQELRAIEDAQAASRDRLGGLFRSLLHRAFQEEPWPVV